MKKNLLSFCIALLALLPAAVHADTTVTLTASGKTLDGSGNVSVALSGATFSSGRIKMPKSASSSFTVSTKDGSAISKIAITWKKTPSSGFSVNTGSYSSNTWTGSSSSVTFKSTGKSEIQVQQLVITYGGKSSDSGSSDKGSDDKGSSDKGSTTTGKTYTVTLNYSDNELAGTKDFSITLDGSAYLNGKKVYMPQGSSSTMTITYNWDDKVITGIQFTNSKSPKTGTFSANYGTFKSYPKVWAAPEGGLKSVRFSSNGKSIALIKTIKITLVDKDGASKSDDNDDNGNKDDDDNKYGDNTGDDSGSSSNVKGLSKYDLNRPVGWGTVGGSITGSADKNAITVTNIDEFLAAMEGTTPRTIYLKGTIAVGGKVTVKDCSNKTVYGLPGSSFQNLKHSSSVDESGILTMSRCNNIILRNITFKGAGAYDIDGNDNLTLQTCEYIWVDHCDFQDGVDGNFDANNGSDHLSVTWCRFRYLIKPYAGGSGGSDDHRNTCLWGGSDSNAKDVGKLNTTFANCWWDYGCHERNPRVRNGQVHVVNCYYSYEKNNYCIGAGYNSNIYADNNYFDNVNRPWACYATKSGKKDYNITMKDNIGASDVQQKSGTRAYFNPYSVYSYTPYAASLVKSVVTNASNGAGATLDITEGSGVSAAKGNFFDEETTGIQNVVNVSSQEIVKTDIYTINGAHVDEMQRGLNVVKTTYADGTVKVQKILMR